MVSSSSKRPVSSAAASLLLTLSLFFSRSTHARDCERSWRRAWRDMSCDEQDDFLDVLTRMKESGVYDEFVHVHETFASQTHGFPLFLPWHR
jgi:hypothetical protein